MSKGYIDCNVARKITNLIVNSLLSEFIKELEKRYFESSNYVYDELYTEEQKEFINELHPEYFQKLRIGFQFHIDDKTYRAKPGLNKRYMGEHCGCTNPRSKPLRIKRDHEKYDYIKSTFEIGDRLGSCINMMTYRLINAIKVKTVRVGGGFQKINTIYRMKKMIEGAENVLNAISVNAKFLKKSDVLLFIESLSDNGIIKNILSPFGVENDEIDDCGLFFNSSNSSYDNICKLMLNNKDKGENKDDGSNPRKNTTGTPGKEGEWCTGVQG